MGNLKDLAGMLPGVGKMLKNVDIPDDVFKQTEAIVSSMTPAEREHPEIINARRRERIAKGSGTTMADVNRLMKQFEDTPQSPQREQAPAPRGRRRHPPDDAGHQKAQKNNTPLIRISGDKKQGIKSVKAKDNQIIIHFSSVPLF